MQKKEGEDLFVFYTDKLSYEVKDGPEGKQYYAEGYISTHDLDLVNDIVTEKGMKEMYDQLLERDIKLDFQHEAFRGDNIKQMQINKTIIPLAKSCDRTRDKKGIKVNWKFNQDWKKFDSKGDVVMTFKDVWKNVENKFYDAFSIAFIPTGTNQVTGKDGKSIRLLDGINLLNVALTGNPVNTTAKMTAVMAKSLDYIRKKEELKMSEKDELVKQIMALDENLKESDLVIKSEEDLKAKKEELEEEEAKKEKQEGKDVMDKLVGDVKALTESVQEIKDNKEPPKDADLKDLKEATAEIKSIKEEVKGLEELKDLKDLKEQLKDVDVKDMLEKLTEIKDFMEKPHIKSLQDNANAAIKATEAALKDDNEGGALDAI